MPHHFWRCLLLSARCFYNDSKLQCFCQSCETSLSQLSILNLFARFDAPHSQFLTQPLTNFSLVIGWVKTVFGSEQLQREGFGRNLHGGSKRVRKEINVEQKRSKIRQAQIVRQTDQVSLQLFLSVSQVSNFWWKKKLSLQKNVIKGIEIWAPRLS